MTSPWSGPIFAGSLAGTSFQFIEIDALLAFQFTVDDTRSNHHCGHLSDPPTIAELMALCLPLNPDPSNIQTYQNSQTPFNQSMILKSRNLNVRAFGAGMFNAQFMGVQFGMSLPFSHVVRYNNRCYLHNGFHRSLGVRRAGATHMPCVLRDVTDPAAIGIADKATFGLPLMESANPPTLGHFTNGRAHPVALRRTSRILHVSWAEYVLPDE
jgi:hypothetical protein